MNGVWVVLLVIAAGVVGMAGTWAMESGERNQYAAAQKEAVRFAARMGVIHGGCANESCSGLRDGKPIRYFCQPGGCVFEGAQQ